MSTRPKPTAIVDSGNGIQCLWRLKESIALNDANDIIRHLCLLAAKEALRRKLFQVAMNPLFTANMIKVENYGRPSRPCECTPARNLSLQQKIFLQKRLSHKGYPLYGTEPFLDRFLGEGA